MRRKILLCITKAAAGGAQKYIYDVATHVPAGRFETVVVAGASGPLFARLGKAGIRAISVPSLGRDINPLNEIRSFFNLVRIFIKEKPDIIHLNSSKMGSMGAIAAFMSKLLTLNFKPAVIFTVHGWGFREDRSTAQRAAIFAASWISARFHNHIIAINAADHADANAFIPRKKISFIPLGISTPAFLSREDARAVFSEKLEMPISDNTFLIGTTAELTKNKGLAYLIDAMHHLSLNGKSNIRCIIMGEGEERANLRERINALHLDHRVTLAGFVADASRYLPAFDIFVLPSVKEGLPYALMEAMSAKLPIVASRVGGIPDLIAHGETGLLAAAKDSFLLAAHIQRLLASPDERTSFGLGAYQTVSANHPLAGMITSTINLYDQLTQPHQ